MPQPIRIRAKEKKGAADVRVLIAHEMETGQRKNSKGEKIPAWFINEVTASFNGKPVMKAHWGPAISKNPYMAFSVPGAKKGDKISISWVDNKGETRTDDAVVK